MAQDVGADDDNKAEANAETGEGLFKKLVGQDFSAQGSYFLNVYWKKHGDKKDEVFALYDLFMLNKQGDKNGFVESGPFSLMLETLEKQFPQSAVADFPRDPPSKKARFKAAGVSGFRKLTQFSYIGTLLAFYGETISEMATLPVTPANEELAAALKEQAEVQAYEPDLKAEKAEIEKVRVTQRSKEQKDRLKAINAILTAPDRQKTQISQESACRKRVKAAKAALTKENNEGTEASNCFKAYCASTDNKRKATEFVVFKLD